MNILIRCLIITGLQHNKINSHSTKLPCSDIVNENRYLNFGQAVMVRRPSRYPVPYDHTCKIMKARYNCAHAMHIDEKATDWILGFESRSGAKCLMKDLLLKSGGILTLRRHIAHWSHRGFAEKKAHILLVGNSFLRQIFEAIVCSFSDNETVGPVMVEVGGPDMSLSTLEMNNKFDLTSLGSMVPLADLDGCHAFEPYSGSHWYEADEFTPLSRANCSDNIATVEIANIKFYYLFRPYSYSNLRDVFSLLEWNVHKFDAIVSNEDIAIKSIQAAFPFLLRKIYPLGTVTKNVTQSGISVINLNEIVRYFFFVQKRQLHRWFGADNVGISQPPDSHPCMPGPPDDELDVLLFMLSHNIRGIAWN